MIKVLEIFCGSVFIWFVEYLAGKILLNNSQKGIVEKAVLIIIFSIALSIINIGNFEVFHGIVKVFSVYLLQTLFYKFMFNESLSKSMIVALIWYLCISVSEVIIVLIISIITSIIKQPMQFIKNNFIINDLIVGISLVIIEIFKNKFKRFIKNTSTSRGSYVIIIAVILITLALLLFKIPFNSWKFNSEFLITMLIILCFSIIGIYLIKQRSDIENTTSMYQQVVKYSNTTNKVLEDYRMINHEHKNQLSIIRQMVSAENTELIEYLDNLIDKRNIQKYKWVAELNKLTSEGLKGLINYKLIEMEENGISSMVTISKEISKIKLERRLTTAQKDHLYSICGVYLDNAIEAAIKSKTKEINIDIYKEKKDLVLIIANTYKGKINLERIDEYGYTTKGKNHGVGLHIVKNILNEDRLFSQSRKLIDKYYVQELRIHTDKFKNKKSKK